MIPPHIRELAEKIRKIAMDYGDVCAKDLTIAEMIHAHELERERRATELLEEVDKTTLWINYPTLAKAIDTFLFNNLSSQHGGNVNSPLKDEKGRSTAAGSNPAELTNLQKPNNKDWSEEACDLLHLAYLELGGRKDVPKSTSEAIWNHMQAYQKPLSESSMSSASARPETLFHDNVPQTLGLNADGEMEALKNSEPAQWISVKDRLPPETDDYLTFYPKLDRVLVVRFYTSDCRFDGLDQPSHWMPLPEPPAQSLAATNPAELTNLQKPGIGDTYPSSLKGASEGENPSSAQLSDIDKAWEKKEREIFKHLGAASECPDEESESHSTEKVVTPPTRLRGITTSEAVTNPPKEKCPECRGRGFYLITHKANSCVLTKGDTCIACQGTGLKPEEKE